VQGLRDINDNSVLQNLLWCEIRFYPEDDGSRLGNSW
jgi:hypothetical protein